MVNVSFIRGNHSGLLSCAQKHRQYYESPYSVLQYASQQHEISIDDASFEFCGFGELLVLKISEKCVIYVGNWSCSHFKWWRKFPSHQLQEWESLLWSLPVVSFNYCRSGIPTCYCTVGYEIFTLFFMQSLPPAVDDSVPGSYYERHGEVNRWRTGSYHISGSRTRWKSR